jgi:hypothetical protein
LNNNKTFEQFFLLTVAEEHQELRDELDDAIPNPPLPMDIQPQEADSSKKCSRNILMTDDLARYPLNPQLGLQVSQQESFAFPNDTVMNYHLLHQFQFPKTYP